MSEIKGDHLGHFFRRLTHVAMCLLPILYYVWGAPIAAVFGLGRLALLLVLTLLVVILECVRLLRGSVYFGQRSYERHQVSALAWGAVSIALVCVFAPDKSIGIPIIWVCAFADPLMGEMRARAYHTVWVAVAGLLVATLIWVSAVFILGTPWWLAVICPIIAIAVEYPRLRWIDDNALMMIIPLGVSLITM